MKIVYLNPSGELGGAEMSLLDIFASLRDAEPDWSLRLIVSSDGPLVSRARTLGVETVILSFPKALARLGDAGLKGPGRQQMGRFKLFRNLLAAGPPVLTYLRQLRRTLKQVAPDLIHTNGFKMHILGIVARPRKVPVIWHVRDYVRQRPVMAKLMKLFSGRCSLALTNSKSVAADLKAACGNGLRVQTVYNGVDTKVFSPRGGCLDLDSLSGLPHANGTTVRIGMLATLARWKGHETFMRAFSFLPPSMPLRGYIVGGALYETDGSQYSLAELKEMACELGIADRFGFTGFVDHPADVMRSLDIVVHSSTQPEPFGNVIAQGMACGRAVIASNAGGAAELVEANVNALSHPPGDAIALAQGIEELAKQPDLRARLGAAGRETAEQRFDRTRLAWELSPIYRNVIYNRNDDKAVRVTAAAS
jgi:glycosyltransferase involved in cell wall biosynthesis